MQVNSLSKEITCQMIVPIEIRTKVLRPQVEFANHYSNTPHHLPLTQLHFLCIHFRVNQSRSNIVMGSAVIVCPPIVSEFFTLTFVLALPIVIPNSAQLSEATALVLNTSNSNCPICSLLNRDMFVCNRSQFSTTSEQLIKGQVRLFAGDIARQLSIRARHMIDVLTFSFKTVMSEWLSISSNYPSLLLRATGLISSESNLLLSQQVTLKTPTVIGLCSNTGCT